MSETDYHACRLLGTIDEREHKVHTLVVPLLKLELALRGISYSSVKKKEDLESLLIQHMDTPILDDKCNVQALKSPEVQGLCQKFELKITKTNKADMIQELKQDDFVDANGELFV